MAKSAHDSQRIDNVRAAVLTVSDTRSMSTDNSGAIIKQLLESAGHSTHSHEIVPDEPALVGRVVSGLCEMANCDAVILNGGTGIGPRDSTLEGITKTFDKELPGFGELFRQLSFDEIGANAILSRAAAGVIGDTIVYSLPGSPNAVTLAMQQLILPSLPHAVWLLRPGQA